MADTEVIHDHSGSDSSSGMSFLLGFVVLVILAMALIFYGIPALGNARSGSAGTNINVPDKINVEVNQPK